MWELGHKESWVPKNWCFWTVVLEKTLESPLDCKEIKPVNSKGNQHWIFIERDDWCWSWTSNTLIRRIDSLEKTLMLGKDWRQEKGMTENEMVGWQRMRWLDGITDSGSWWWTGKPGMLQSMALCQTQLRNWTDWLISLLNKYVPGTFNCQELF